MTISYDKPAGHWLLYRRSLRKDLAKDLSRLSPALTRTVNSLCYLLAICPATPCLVGLLMHLQYAIICDLAHHFPNMEIRFLPSVHAKVYIADEHLAVITSSNMTNNGLLKNYEYGVKIQDSTLTGKVREDITTYAQLGTRIDLDKLRYLAQTSAELSRILADTERGIKSRLRTEFKIRLREFDDEIVRIRAAERVPHAIFAEAILYLLSHKPLSTSEMQPIIQGIHPDLCDDNVDRVIDGRHFGKKWKHAVRTAQQHLKRDGKLELKNGLWHLRSFA